MKLKYIGNYTGIVPWLRRTFKPGEEFDEPNEEVAKKLLATGQFKQIVSERSTELGGE